MHLLLVHCSTTLPAGSCTACVAVPASSERAPDPSLSHWMASSLRRPITDFSAAHWGSARSRAPKILSSSILLLGRAIPHPSTLARRTAGSLHACAAARCTISWGATPSPTSTTSAPHAPIPRPCAAASNSTTTWRRSTSSTGPPAVEEVTQQQDAAVPSSPAAQQDALVPASEEKVKVESTPSSQAQMRLETRGRKRQSDAAAGLRWCAQQLASSYDGFGDSEAEALAYLEQKGVECTSNCGTHRLFRFPGCNRPLRKKPLAEALGLQEKAGSARSSKNRIQLKKRGRKRQSDAAAGLRWCAQQLASSYDGFGDSEDEALAYLEQKGVECTSNCGRMRLFRFPGCSRPVRKKYLVEALGLQRKPTPEAEREDLAKALHWCAQQLASAYQGVGDNQEQALDLLRGKGVVCAKIVNGVRLFCIPGSTLPVSKDHLAAALGLQVCVWGGGTHVWHHVR
ncbi:hypothetical protein DUNSADRAFT_17847 [Dunaliella salina]|uniref:Uncharacterized protein n=1 Tax=Dunaliella salina TaxID=3046 RepID=A0ABQ7G112_DUNSA|nr:hypothetical protein DUNSADRAFT_17847 [Dunaliella salina]|eukprot:KAF5828299.1 hypothetical protein DUNSADRAFT_17847 [Dunaliella salina]